MQHSLSNQINKSTRKTGANVLNVSGHFQKCLTLFSLWHFTKTFPRYPACAGYALCFLPSEFLIHLDPKYKNTLRLDLAEMVHYEF